MTQCVEDTSNCFLKTMIWCLKPGVDIKPKGPPPDFRPSCLYHPRLLLCSFLPCFSGVGQDFAMLRTNRRNSHHNSNPKICPPQTMNSTQVYRFSRDASLRGCGEKETCVHWWPSTNDWIQKRQGRPSCGRWW